MDAVSYSGFRKNLKNYMQQVNEDAEVLMVTSQSTQEDIVVMSKRDYDAMQETLRILSNRPLMEKIRRGEEQYHHNQTHQHPLLDDDGDSDD